MAGDYASWHGHVSVCGLHGVGLLIVEELSLSGVPAVVVDDNPDPRLARTLHGWGGPHVAGSPLSADTLTSAGLSGAAAVICVLEDDLHTLEAAMLTRELRAGVRVIVQLGNPAVGRALQGIDISVLDVAGLSAPSIAQACLQAPQEIRLAGPRFCAGRVSAPRTATLRELYGELTPVVVLPRDAADGNIVVCPGRDHRVAAGDDVTLFGSPDELQAAGVTGDPAGAAPARPARPGVLLRQLAWSLVQAAD